MCKYIEAVMTAIMTTKVAYLDHTQSHIPGNFSFSRPPTPYCSAKRSRWVHGKIVSDRLADADMIDGCDYLGKNIATGHEIK